MPPGWSATWQAIYQRRRAGQFIAAPYHDVKVTDPDKLAQMTDGVRRVAAAARRSTARHPRRVPRRRRCATWASRRAPSSTAARCSSQQCQQCHNARLDPTITRDKFLVDQLDQMTRAEKDLAIERLQTPLDTRLTMPPPLFRTPTDAERQLMIDELQEVTAGAL